MLKSEYRMSNEAKGSRWPIPFVIQSFDTHALFGFRNPSFLFRVSVTPW